MVSVGVVLPIIVTLVHNGVVITNFANAANGGMPLMGVVEFGLAGEMGAGEPRHPPARPSFSPLEIASDPCGQQYIARYITEILIYPER